MTNLTPEPIWKQWAKSIQKLGLEDLTATLLEATRPINSLGAQMVYLGQPMLNSLFDDKNLEALAQMLEEPTQTQKFINYLKEI